MSTDWKAAFTTALAEHDPAKLPQLCDQARVAINTHLMQLEPHANPREREELNEALRRVTMHLLSENRPS